MKNLLLLGSAVALGYFLFSVSLADPKQQSPKAGLSRLEVPTSFEIDKLKSRWYWLDSEVMTSKHSDNWARVAIYAGFRSEVETELKTHNVCVSKKEWSRCDGLR